MTAASAPPRLEGLPPPDHDNIVVLYDWSWEDYERLLERRGDRSAPRVTFLEGTLEIMSPSRSHEAIKSTIGSLLEAWCLEHDVEFTTLGSWTIKNRAKQRGAEPDECYVFGPDSSDRERPDLAIEVVWTSGGIGKLEVYRKLAVREVWYWKAGIIRVFALRGETYEEVSVSEVLPALDHRLLASFVDRDTTSEAIRAYRDAMRPQRPG